MKYNLYVWIDTDGKMSFSGGDRWSPRSSENPPEWLVTKIALLQTVEEGVEVPGVGKRLTPLVADNMALFRVEEG